MLCGYNGARYLEKPTGKLILAYVSSLLHKILKQNLTKCAQTGEDIERKQQKLSWTRFMQVETSWCGVSSPIWNPILQLRLRLNY